MISVAVCTYNRAGKLRNLLTSLERMDVPAHLAWEVIVVNNNSTDDTADVIAHFAAAGTIPVRCVVEGRQGLSFARNRAVSAARGDIIAFTDDDCQVARDWLAVIAREFEQDEALRLLGGRVELFNPNDRPITIRTGLERLDLTGNTDALDILLGCNLVFRRGAVQDVGGFDTRFGVGSGLVPSGDDVDFVYRILRLRERVLYSPDLVVLHDHGRASDEQVNALRSRYLLGRGGFYAKHMLAGDRTAARMAYWEARNLLGRALSIRAERRENLRVLSLLLSGAAAFWRNRKVALPTPEAARGADL